MNNFTLAALALAIEMFAGYPPALYKLIGHPVEWIGKLIPHLDHALNDPDASAQDQRNHGIFAIIALIVIVGIPSYAIAKALSAVPYGWIINVLLATVFIAQKSLRDHVSAVINALPQSISLARREVAKIVGRDPEILDESGIAKATLESLAENSADGVVAPILWYALLGLPGIVIYKTINTADSMIGHKSKKYLNFGWATAKLDDLVNLPASRLTGLLFAGAARLQSATAAKAALNAMWHDAGKHQSPNAGWPESAMAGALDLRFGGPRNYEGTTIDLPFMGNGREQIVTADIARGLTIYDHALIILLGLSVLLAMVL